MTGLRKIFGLQGDGRGVVPLPPNFSCCFGTGVELFTDPRGSTRLHPLLPAFLMAVVGGVRPVEAGVQEGWTLMDTYPGAVKISTDEHGSMRCSIELNVGGGQHKAGKG